MTTSSPRTCNIISKKDITAITVILLISFSYMYFYNSRPINHLGGDQLVYNQLAVNMLKGFGFSQCVVPPYFPSIVRTPVYPAFLACIYWIFGIENFEAVRIAQILLMLFSALMIFKIALLVTNNKYIAFIAFIFFSFYGFNYYSGFGVYGYLFTEPLVIFLVNGSTLLLILVIKQKSAVISCVMGVMLALSMLTRPSNLFFPGFVAIFLLCLNFSKQSMKLVFSMAIFVLVIITPWTVRNYLQFEKVIPLSVSLKGLFIYGGLANNPDYIPNSKTGHLSSEVEISEEQRRRANEAISGLYSHFLYGGIGVIEISKYDDTLNEIGVQILKENKGIFLKRWYYRILSHWSVGDLLTVLYRTTAFSGKDHLKIILKIFLVFLIFIGSFRYYNNALFLTLLLFPLYNTIMYTPLTHEYRYSLPARSLVIVIIAIGLYDLLNYIFRSPRKR